ncbi:MAG: hypothetical protein WC055_11955 [Melioribacteraceae bacterium]
MHFNKDDKKSGAKRIGYFILALIGGVIVFGGLVMYLWNAILPPVLGVASINFLQAMGIFVLAKILFGGFPHGGSKRDSFHHSSIHSKEMREKWMNLTPEEREKMRESWTDRFHKKEKSE